MAGARRPGYVGTSFVATMHEPVTDMTRSELEELRTYLDRRFDAVEDRLDVTERQHRELVVFLGRKFDGIDARFEGVEGRLEGVEGRLDGVEQRLTKVEVGQEGIRHDIQLLAEGFGATTRRIDRLEGLHEDDLA